MRRRRPSAIEDLVYRTMDRESFGTLVYDSQDLPIATITLGERSLTFHAIATQDVNVPPVAEIRVHGLDGSLVIRTTSASGPGRYKRGAVIAFPVVFDVNADWYPDPPIRRPELPASRPTALPGNRRTLTGPPARQLPRGAA